MSSSGLRPEEIPFAGRAGEETRFFTCSVGVLQANAPPPLLAYESPRFTKHVPSSLSTRRISRMTSTMCPMYASGVGSRPNSQRMASMCSGGRPGMGA